jgi:RNA polymerase sigma-70 factor (ECF subfamily)
VKPEPVGAQSIDDFAAFYAVTYARLVGVLARVCDGREDAEEVVQEAFVRLVQRWSKVSRYDDPEAWVRQVAFRLATSRWRRRRAGAAALLRLGPARHVSAPSVDRVAVDAVLAPLTPAHRAVLVLHHAVGLSVDEIAAELGVAPGTVKSRLSRARAAAAAAYGEDDHA